MHLTFQKALELYDKTGGVMMANGNNQNHESGDKEQLVSFNKKNCFSCRKIISQLLFGVKNFERRLSNFQISFSTLFPFTFNLKKFKNISQENF